MSHPGVLPRFSDWCSFHLYYHENADRLLIDFVQPTLAALLRDRVIDRYFFVRQGLGGPHIRLRVRVSGERGESVSARFCAEARAFFHTRPSRSPLPEERIRAIHESVLRTDPHETDDVIQPDNHVREVTFVPEMERYGGPEHICSALEYFAVSSLGALVFLRTHSDMPRARQLPLIAQIMFREAWAFADDVEELMTLLGFMAHAGGAAMASIATRGDRLFEQHEQMFMDLIAAQTDKADEHGAAFLLAGTLAHAPHPARLSALSSQMHMTANRLGLSNAEEVYLSRILWRAVHGHGPEALRRQLASRRGAHPSDAASMLRQLVAQSVGACLSNPLDP